ncbi:MAG: Ig-like domain-containing protein [Promethearchaeota archaeon]
MNQTESIVITLNDIIGPSVTILNPPNGSNQDNFISLDINATISDPGSGVSSAIAMVNTSIGNFNLTMQYIAGTWTATWVNTSLYAEGDYNVTIWAIDGKGNVNQTVYHSFTLTDGINPEVNILVPSDGNSFDNTQDVEINATITDTGSGVAGAKAMINSTLGDFNLTMQVVAGTWTVTWTNTSLYAEGDYNITLWAIDGKGNVNETEHVIISLNDVLNPSVTIDEPADLSSHDNDAGIEINATVTDPGSGVASVKAMINSTLGDFNLTMQYISGTWTATWTNTSLYAEGDYNITIWAIDNKGYINQTESIVITLNDIIGPSVDILNPPNGSNQDNFLPFDINATITDPGSGVAGAKAMINSTLGDFNLTMQYIAGTWTVTWVNTSLYAEGDYNITIWAIDGNGNVNQTEYVIITLTDGINPEVNILVPSDGNSFDNTQDVEINATITDTGSGVAGAKAMINSTLGDFNLTMQEIVGTWTVIWDNTSLYVEGDYEITIWAIDGKGNVNETESVVITLNDVLNPSVSIDDPTDLSTHDTDASIEINATIVDLGSGVARVKAIINSTLGDFNLTMQEIAGTWTVTWVNTSLYYVEGDYKITIWAIDGTGNVNQTEFVIITRIDLTKPIIFFISPSNSTIVTNDVNITVQIIDANLPDINNVIAEIYNGTVLYNFNLTMVRIGTTNYWTILWDNLSDYSQGEYRINVTAIDSSLNQNRNSTGFLNITFIFDTEAPRFIFPPGFNNTVITSIPFIIEVNISDDYSSPEQGSVIIEFSNNPSLFNASMEHISGDLWRFTWTNISSYSNGVYKIQIHAIDSSLNRNSNSSSIFFITVNLSSGEGPGGPDFPFLLLIIIAAIIIVAVVALTIIISRRRGHRTSIEERDRIGRLTGESLCERCEYFDAEAEFCNKLLVIKRFNLNAPCKEYKRKSIAPAVEKAKEEAEGIIYEPVPGTACEACQNYNYKTGLCDKYLTYPQLKPDQFCKGFKKFKDEGEKGKPPTKAKSGTDKLLGPELCAACQFQELDTGFCKKFLTYKKLKPNESCKGFKRKKENEET